MTVTVRVHHDGDGIIAGYFTAFNPDIKEPKIEIWDGAFGDTTGLKEGDWMCDMRPLQNMKGLNVIDHHGPHPEDRKYNLIADTVPASLIAWRQFKDDIPKSEWWKLAIGLMGDGQPELIPTEVFESCPQLLLDVKTSAYKTYGKWSLGNYPIYKLLSSNVNGLLRKGDYTEALNLVRYSEKPINILHSLKAKAAKRDVATEFENIIKSCDMYNFPKLAIFIFNSEYRMTGYVASSMQESLDNKTIMAINRKDGSGSLRGDLAYYWRDKFKHIDYLNIGGHPGFCGVTITGNPDNLIEDILKVIEKNDSKFGEL